jgi:RNA polymerase sigma factor (sigma-70 family)
MFNKKKERYWDKLDNIDNKWRKVMNGEYKKMKKEQSKYNNWFRSIESMTEELVYLVSRDSKFIQDEDEDEKERAEAKKEYERAAMAKKLRSAIGSLTERQKKVIELYYFGGRKQKEIAEEMGCTQENVSNILARAMAKLAKKLSK